jgi:hypothetical protein
MIVLGLVLVTFLFNRGSPSPPSIPSVHSAPTGLDQLLTSADFKAKVMELISSGPPRASSSSDMLSKLSEVLRPADAPTAEVRGASLPTPPIPDLVGLGLGLSGNGNAIVEFVLSHLDKIDSHKLVVALLSRLGTFLGSSGKAGDAPELSWLVVGVVAMLLFSVIGLVWTVSKLLKGITGVLARTRRKAEEAPRVVVSTESTPTEALPIRTTRSTEPIPMMTVSLPTTVLAPIPPRAASKERTPAIPRGKLSSTKPLPLRNAGPVPSASTALVASEVPVQASDSNAPQSVEPEGPLVKETSPSSPAAETSPNAAAPAVETTAATPVRAPSAFIVQYPVRPPLPHSSPPTALQGNSVMVRAPEEPVTQSSPSLPPSWVNGSVTPHDSPGLQRRVGEPGNHPELAEGSETRKGEESRQDVRETTPLRYQRIELGREGLRPAESPSTSFSPSHSSPSRREAQDRLEECMRQVEQQPLLVDALLLAGVPTVGSVALSPAIIPNGDDSSMPGVSGAPSITDSWIQYVANRCPNLTAIDLSHRNGQVTATSLGYLLTHSPRLKSLKLVATPSALSSTVVHLLAQYCPLLETLDISDCRLGSNADGPSASPGLQGSRAVSRRLEDFSGSILDAASASHSPSPSPSPGRSSNSRWDQEDLDNPGFSSLPSQVDLLRLLTNLTNLTSVHLNGTQVSDYAVEQLVAASGSQLVELGLAFTKGHITDKSVLLVGQHCTALKSLNVGWTNGKVTDKSLTVVGSHCTQLQHLDVSLTLGRITDATMKSMTGRCRYLTILNVSYTAGKISDAGLAPLIRNCPNLAELNVSYTYGAIGDATMAAVAECCPRFTSGDFSYTDNSIRLLTVLKLAERASGLKQLDISWAVVEWKKESSPNPRGAFSGSGPATPPQSFPFYLTPAEMEVLLGSPSNTKAFLESRKPNFFLKVT